MPEQTHGDWAARNTKPTLDAENQVRRDYPEGGNAAPVIAAGVAVAVLVGVAVTFIAMVFSAVPGL